MFQDLVYSIEIAAHAAGLEHYAPRMAFDAVAVVQQYRECFAPEEWTPPYDAHAEIEFEMSALDTARAQMSDRGIIETLGVALGPGSRDLENFSPILAHLNFTFVLSVSALGDPASDEWNGYRHQVTERERLQAGLENLQRRLQRAIGDQEASPPIHIQARTTLTGAGRLVLSELTALWPVSIQADVQEDQRQLVLEDIMKRVRAGLGVLSELAQDIQDAAGRTS